MACSKGAPEDGTLERRKGQPHRPPGSAVLGPACGPERTRNAQPSCPMGRAPGFLDRPRNRASQQIPQGSGAELLGRLLSS